MEPFEEVEARAEGENNLEIVPVEKIATVYDLEAVTADGWEVVESVSYDGAVHTETRQEPVTMNGYQQMQTITSTKIGRIAAFRENALDCCQTK